MDNKSVVCWLVGFSSRRAFEYSGAPPPAQLARPWRHVGIAAPRNADEVPVKFEDKSVTAELCLPGQRSRGAIALRALVDSGAQFTILSLPIVDMMERTFPGVQMRVPFSLGARQAGTASGQKVSVTERTIPLKLAPVTPWGPAPLPPISFAIMPGSDGVLILGLPTLKDLGVDPHERIWDSMQQWVSPPNQGVETPAFLGSRQVSLSVAALQEAGGQATEELDLAGSLIGSL